MGQGTSKGCINGGRSLSSSSSGSDHSGDSRTARFRRKLRRIRHPRSSSSSSSGKHSPTKFKLVAADDFAGIALFTLISAKMQFKDKWMACVSLGEQTFRTHVTDNTDEPVWNSEKKLLLESNGPHLARVSVYETNRLKKNNLIGHCELDLFKFLTGDSDSLSEEVNLYDPSSNSTVVGKLCFSCSVEDPQETEKDFARRILSIVDYNEDGLLSLSEFSDLIDAFGNQVAVDKKEELFKAADKDGDGVVSMDELAELLALHQEKEPLINTCPVCSEVLDASNWVGSMVHMTLCFNEGTGNNVMIGGFLTDKQASYGWLLKLSEWAHYSSYGIGVRTGSKAEHILVFDRVTKRLVEELIDGKIIMAMRTLYQTKMGLFLLSRGGNEILQNLSTKQGEKMNSVESAKDIPKFLESFKDQINLSEVKYPLDHFKTFNEFFIRELKPETRPVACKDRDDVAVCAADCRLMAFSSVQDSTRFWIKGRKFSVQGLLGKDVSASPFIDGTLVIFRLAPQDYHRSHFPVSGTIEQFVPIPGSLYTVNLIAVNSSCNVFSENKRVVSIISTAYLGRWHLLPLEQQWLAASHLLGRRVNMFRRAMRLQILLLCSSVVHIVLSSPLYSSSMSRFFYLILQFGNFSFGGSTVICLFEKGVIKIDDDLLDNSARSLETLVRVGMTLGVSNMTPY